MPSPRERMAQARAMMDDDPELAGWTSFSPGVTDRMYAPRDLDYASSMGLSEEELLDVMARMDRVRSEPEIPADAPVAEAYDGTFNDRVAEGLRSGLESLGAPRTTQQGARDAALLGLSVLPTEAERDYYDMRGNFKAGNYGEAALNAGMLAMGAIPGVSAAKSAAKAYTRDGEAIAKRLEDHPSAREIAGMPTEPHGAGFSNLKSQKANLLRNHQSEGFTDPDLEAPVLTDIADMEGSTLMSIVGDPTGRHTVTSVGGKKLETPVKSLGGFEYTQKPGQGYAGAQSATASKLNEALETENPAYVTIRMADKSGDFAKHQGNMLSEMFKTAEIEPKDVDWIDNNLRNIPAPDTVKLWNPDGSPMLKPDGTQRTKGITVRPFGDFTTVRDPNSVSEFINSLPTGTRRAAFLKGMDRTNLLKRGFPNVAEARLSVADEKQIGHDWGTTGYRMIRPDLDKGHFPTTAENSTTYDTGIDKVGSAMTLLPEDSMGIPANLLFRDLSAMKRANDKGGRLVMNAADYKTLESSPKNAKQFVDAQLVDIVSTFLELEKRGGRRAAMDFAQELLSGGKITNEMIKAARKANTPKWMIAAMTGGATGAGMLGAMEDEEAGVY